MFSHRAVRAGGCARGRAASVVHGLAYNFSAPSSFARSMSPSAPATLAGITVDLVYLARLREAFGRGHETLTLSKAPARHPVTVADVLTELRGRGGAFAEALAPGRAVRVAVNHDVVTLDHPLRDGDEVALFPPVTGG